MRDTVKKFKIKPKYIINMDETPFYWEYLPRKIITRKLAKKSKAWKRGYHQVRSTVVLCTAADGTILRPSIILKRQAEYSLCRANNINLLLLNSKSGWMDEENMLKWLKEILFPYVQKNPCLLLMDSYEAHLSGKVRELLQEHPNIQTGIIIGGTTDRLQPLDVGTNKPFKDLCRKQSIEYSNRILEAMHEVSAFDELKQSQSQSLMKGNLLFNYF